MWIREYIAFVKSAIPREFVFGRSGNEFGSGKCIVFVKSAIPRKFVFGHTEIEFRLGICIVFVKSLGYAVSGTRIWSRNSQSRALSPRRRRIIAAVVRRRALPVRHAAAGLPVSPQCRPATLRQTNGNRSNGDLSLTSLTRLNEGKP